MRSVMVMILAATAVALPISFNIRQLPSLGGATSPLTGIISEVGGQVTPVAGKVEDTITPDMEDGTQPDATNTLGGLSGLTGIIGGLTGGL
ncbi:hypothetical protein F5Y18DRAFT_92494 [Xylariaceae sp. FL1019]|nr:hypothetical protein F5Y18DRAFT_92494 [Xylariaceae sp. FL1019]